MLAGTVKLKASMDPRISLRKISSAEGVGASYFKVGTGPAIVISNAVGIHPKFWEPFMLKMKSTNTIYLLNTRGHWYSDAIDSTSQLKLASQVADLSAIVNNECLEDYIILGYCSGCALMNYFLRELTCNKPIKVVYLSTIFKEKDDSFSELFQMLADKEHPTHKTSLPSLKYILLSRCPSYLVDYLDELLSSEASLRFFIFYLSEIYATPITVEPSFIKKSIIINFEHDLEDVKKSNFTLINTTKMKIETHTIPELTHFSAYEAPDSFSKAFSRIIGE